MLNNLGSQYCCW